MGDNCSQGCCRLSTANTFPGAKGNFGEPLAQGSLLQGFTNSAWKSDIYGEEETGRGEAQSVPARRGGN